MEIKNIDYYMNLKYKIDITPIEDEGEMYFSASIPDLPGLEVFEDTVNEALASLEDASFDVILCHNVFTNHHQANVFGAYDIKDIKKFSQRAGNRGRARKY